MESSTQSNTIKLELHGLFAQPDLFPFMWTPRVIFAFLLLSRNINQRYVPRPLPVNDRIHCIVK